jgi:hypothetical protein
VIEERAREKSVLRDLGDGLVLRRATVEDTEALVAFNAGVFREPGAQEPDKWIAAWTRDLMKGNHPTFDVGDILVVEDTRKRALVSTCSLISQTWSYGDVKFGVGRPELVATHPDYRNRGLVRAQFAMLHELSAARGEKVQAITGIPYYYRQFGYEMGLSLEGGRLGYKVHVPKLKEGDPEPYRLRPATDEDVPLLMRLYEQQTARSMVSCLRDEEMWRYELHGRDENSAQHRAFQVIETPEGEAVGMLVHSSRLWGPTMAALLYELLPGASWTAVTPSVVRHLEAAGEQYAAVEKKREFGAFGFLMGTEHPVYKAFENQLPRTWKPYAWYVRVADLPDFIRHVAPVLERRVAQSNYSGHTGEIKVSFYRDGLRLALEGGKIAAERWKPTPEDRGVAGFPDLTFLQLLFGYRNLDELRYAFADCTVDTDEARELLTTMFPKQPTDIWPVA